MLHLFFYYAWTLFLSLFISKERVFVWILKKKKIGRYFYTILPFNGFLGKIEPISLVNYKIQGNHFGLGPCFYLFKISEFMDFIERYNISVGFYDGVYTQHDDGICYCDLNIGVFDKTYEINSKPFSSVITSMVPEDQYLYCQVLDEYNFKSIKPIFQEHYDFTGVDGSKDHIESIDSLTEINNDVEGEVKGLYSGHYYSYRGFVNFLKLKNLALTDSFEIKPI